MDPALLRKMKNINQLSRQNQKAGMLLRFRSVRDSIMKSIQLIPNERYQEASVEGVSSIEGCEGTTVTSCRK